MAKEKFLTKKRGLGKVVKKLANGMYETSTGDRIPPYAGVSVGDEISLDEDGKIVLPEKEQPKMATDETVSRKEFEELKKQNEALAKMLGEKGSDVKKTGSDK